MGERTEVHKAIEEPGNIQSEHEQVDFETAISLTGYGKFNYMLNLVAIPAAWSIVFETTTMSYILPSAECDLNLSNLDKGILNAMVYAGMISGGFFWGFFSDTLGRQKLLIASYFLLAVVVVSSSFSQAFWILTVFKFLGGFMSGGPYAILLTYLAEFSSCQHRARAMMIFGLYASIASVAIAALAWLLIPQSWSWSLFGQYITYHSWHVFILASALPSFLAGCGMCYFSESPRFLMSCGRRDEALSVFRRIYSINTGKPPESYPVKSLLEEKAGILTADAPNNRLTTVLKLGIKQMKPFCHKPHVGKAALVFSIQFGGLWGLNTVRLWLPQLFAIVEEYFITKEPVSGNATICVMLASHIGPKNVFNETLRLVDEPCVPVEIGDTMYIYSIIVGAATVGVSLSASYVINCLGKRKILVVGYVLSCCCVVSMYWCNSMEMLLVLASVYVGASSVSTNALMSVVVDLFPTSLR